MSRSTAEAVGPTELLARWDAQQTAYIRHRDERFATMARVLELAGRPVRRVLDLACGPGSLTRLVRDRFPEAEVVALDKDPVLLAIARDVFAGDPAVSVVAADLEVAGWDDGLGRFDAVISSTALHWLPPEQLTRVYFRLAEIIEPGGIFLNGDHLQYDETSTPTLRAVSAADDEAQQATSIAAEADTWDEWWALAEAWPDYAAAVDERRTCWAAHRPTPKVTLGYHLETLRSAGFAEVGTVWRYLDDVVVAGVR